MAQGVASTPAPQQDYAEAGGPSEPRPQWKRDGYRRTYGAIDLGTNNCRLLVARPTEGGFTVIDAFSRIVRLGEGLSQSGRLSDEAMHRAVGALSICADKLRRRNVSLSRSVATEACRRAVNGREFTDRVRDETGIVLDIIEPAEEARLAVLGCHKLLEPGDGPGPDLRHRRWVDGAGAGRPGGRHAAHPCVVECALGGRVADRERRERGT